MQSNLKIKLSSIVFAGILIQILSTQGILTYNIFKFLGNWEIKKYIHPLGIFIVSSCVLISLFSKGKNKSSIEFILLFSYFFLQYLFLFFFQKIDLPSMYYSLRELVLIFFLISSYQLFSFPHKYKETISKILLFLTVLNIFFVFLTFYLGPEKYMLLLTGRYFWPVDPELKFKISNFLGSIYRSPGLVGESASLGFFGLFSFFFIFHSKYKKYYWLPVLLVILSFTRSAYLSLFLYSMFLVLSKKKYFDIALKSFPVLVFLIISILTTKILDLTSLWMRIENWNNKIKIDNNILFGTSLNKIGAGTYKNAGFLAVLDSYWLYIYYGIGLLGVLIIIYFFYKKFNYNKNIYIFVSSLMVSGFFISFNQSIPFLVFFPLLSIKKWWINE